MQVHITTDTGPSGASPWDRAAHDLAKWHGLPCTAASLMNVVHEFTDVLVDERGRHLARARLAARTPDGVVLDVRPDLDPDDDPLVQLLHLESGLPDQVPERWVQDYGTGTSDTPPAP